MDVQIMDEPGRHLAVSRFEADLSRIGEQMGQALGTVAAHLARIGVAPAGPAIAHYAIRPDGMTVSAGFVVAAPVCGDDAVIPFRLHRCEVVRGEHVGPYETLPAAYDELRAAAQEHDRKLDESEMWEEYLTGPEVRPEQTRTLISWPTE